MFFCVAVRTNKSKVREIVIIPVPVFMVHLQNLCFCIATQLTFSSAFSQQAQLQCPLCFDFVFRAFPPIFDASPMFICTGPTARLFICACKNRCSTDSARRFFSICFPVTFLATEYSSTPYLHGSSVDWRTTNRTGSIWISLVMINHSPSIPLTHPTVGLCRPR